MVSTGRQRNLLASSRPQPGFGAWLLCVALLWGTFHPSALRAADSPRPADVTLRIVSNGPFDAGSGASAPEVHSDAETAWIEPGEVSLSIEMTGDDPPDGHVRTIVHRLENHGRETVCVGGSRTFRVDGKVVEGVVQHHALCGEPLRVLAPGESATWTCRFSGAGCWSDAPAAVLEERPSLRCGSEVELRSQIWLFRFEDGVERLGGVPVESAPLRFRVGPEMEVGQAIVLEIADGVDLEGLLVEYGLYGRGLSMRRLTPEDGSRRLEIRLDDPRSAWVRPVESVKILAYLPGFRAATLELDWREVGTPTTWEPDLVRLAVAPVQGRLIGPDGEPLANRQVRFSYLLDEAMHFFGISDGSVPSVELGSAVSDPEGRFHVDLPWLLGDPFIEPLSRLFWNSPGVPRSSVRVSAGEWSARLSVEEIYDEELLVRMEEP